MDEIVTVENKEKGYLSANVLKYFAIVAMLIDHIGWAFVDKLSPLGQIMHFIGRFTAPLMCYFVAEGYYHTRNVNKYLLRLGIFAIISHFPFVMDCALSSKPFWIENGRLMLNNQLLTPLTSVIYTLFLGLLALKVWESKSKLRILAVISLCLLSIIGDWVFFVVLWVLGFGIYHGNLKKQLIFYYIVAFTEISCIILSSDNKQLIDFIWQGGVLVAPLFLLLYNGKRGKGGSFNKWFFYIFYPLHLLVIVIFKWYVFI